MKKKCLAIITARGGSKRITRKNIKEFCGKPIIQYSIEAAIESSIFDEVMVSTEDLEIKKIAEECGAMVPFTRSQETSGDMAMTHEVLLEVLDEYKKLGITFEYVCCIYPTAPFITAARLRESYEKLVLSKADAVIPIVAYSFPPQRCFVLKDDKLEFKWPENRLLRSQDLEKWYHDCGQFYFMNTERFLDTHNLIMENTLPIIIDEMEVQDIDNYVDWELAELKYRMRISK
ncbi:N-acylneuraminate cytidylyltransferase [Anaerosporobacter mobilis DSM 15930]|jgi:N-acylneuraminate cytidylyltransferase|uniref:N-acylneuraminate cytidylyltransferase n=1 Tax=Anaerosporobacter mobilis DSM 15930 TaxID=1120996 RepID=A0A1M7LNB3_9FIRM|nr:pseudaminic acid cytidylyltransferase [Anaerosporobacter mobilis]SHM79644.1 N-acylneuraminate cytidylyltransferase [Anaerosporobacter mobilis DSM 15930]